MKMQTKAQLNDLRVSPRKVRLLVDLVRGKQVEEALMQLSMSKKHAALPVKKLIQSAIANASHNHRMKEDSLMVKEAFVNEGKTLYRWMPKAFGRATPIRKRSSHITIVLEGDAEEMLEKRKKEKEPAEEKEETKMEEKNIKKEKISKVDKKK